MISRSLRSSRAPSAAGATWAERSGLDSRRIVRRAAVLGVSGVAVLCLNRSVFGLLVGAVGAGVSLSSSV